MSELCNRDRCNTRAICLDVRQQVPTALSATDCANTRGTRHKYVDQTIWGTDRLRLLATTYLCLVPYASMSSYSHIRHVSAPTICSLFTCFSTHDGCLRRDTLTCLVGVSEKTPSMFLCGFGYSKPHRNMCATRDYTCDLKYDTQYTYL